MEHPEAAAEVEVEAALLGGSLKIALLGLKTVTTGFNALLKKKEDADLLLSERGITLLQSRNLSIKIPLKSELDNHYSLDK